MTKTTRRPRLAVLQAACSHPKCIGLGDVQVCISCEKVLPVAVVS